MLAFRYVFAISIALSASAHPALADAVAGRALARQLCSQCHDIGEPAEPGSVRSGPDFRALARTRSTAELQDFLTAPHKRMRKLALSPQEVRDLVAYIELMKPGG